MAKQKIHYFASHALGWATADTREEAVEKVTRAFARDLKPAIKNCHKAGEPGWYVWSCKVNLPKDAAYRIEFYTPIGAPLTAKREHHVTYLTDKELAFTNREPESEEEQNSPAQVVKSRG